MLLRAVLAVEDRQLRDRLARLLDRLGLWVSDRADIVAPDSHDFVFSDTFVADSDGRGIAARLRGLPDQPGLIVFRRVSGTAEDARLLSAGCYAILDADLTDDLLSSALSGLCQRRMAENLARLQAAEGVDPVDPRNLVSSAPAMGKVLETARRLANAGTPVLILGETGVGKERVARLIHDEGRRRHGPFVAINCAAIPADLAESELFGHEKGAFTGASRAHRGYFELAEKGTLFLDEVGELPLAAQAKLLRALQDQVIRPVGSDRTLSVDVRVVAATNRHLPSEIERGQFRADLYYRLGVVEMEIPPLRERPEDIPLLVQIYLRHHATILGRDIRGLTDEAGQAMAGYPWPGNVRELINVIERAVLLCVGDEIGLEDLPESIREAATKGGELPSASQSAVAGDTHAGSHIVFPSFWLNLPWKKVREELMMEGERAYLTALLTATGGRVGETAKRAGMSERSLFEKMRRHGLRKEDFRSGG